jgi:hypothetical protein
MSFAGSCLLYPDHSFQGFAGLFLHGGVVEISDSLRPAESFLNCIINPAEVRVDYAIPHSFRNTPR